MPNISEMITEAEKTSHRKEYARFTITFENGKAEARVDWIKPDGKPCYIRTAAIGADQSFTYAELEDAVERVIAEWQLRAKR